MPAAPLSIVVPTHNRAATLRRCVEALWAQRERPESCEVVIVDDGSTDETPEVVAALQRRAPIPLTYVHQTAQGPAAARNRGIRAATGDVVLLLGDDIIAEPTLVAEHLRWHARFPSPLVAVLGFVTWSRHITVTPYMRWLEESGNQFDYAAIAGLEGVDPARYLYTANLSLKRSVFDALGEWFDEQFRHALLEDIDLGRRLAGRGLQLKYNAAAVAYHEHAIRLAGYARRIQLSSEYWVLLEGKARAAQGPALVQEPGATRPRRDYLAYAAYLMRVSGEVARNWPFWWAARHYETRAVAPRAFERAHRYWAQRGLLRLEARRGLAKLGVGT
jgi:glycosyltransferase involved in cell wall biosynthesis